MTGSIYIAVLAPAIFGLTAPAVSRRMPPAIASWLLVLGGLITAFAAGTALAVLAFYLLGRHSGLARYWGWSEATLRRTGAVPLVISQLALIIVLALLARSVVVTGRRIVALRRAHALAAGLGGCELVVLDDAGCDAVAVPGRPGRIVLSTGLLRTLDPIGRRAVIAHEAAHLRHHHHLHHSGSLIAAAANPFLRSLPAAVALATERWADECAATAVGRRSVAEAVAAVGGCQPPTASPTLFLAAGATSVVQRVAALLEPAPARSWWRVAFLGLLVAVPVAAVLHSGIETERLYELAQREFLAGG